MTQYKYLRGSQDSREAVEFDITRRGHYITTCVVDVDLLISGLKAFPCGNGDDVKLTAQQRLAILELVQVERKRITDSYPVKTYKGWQESGLRTFEEYCFPDDEVDEEMVDYFLNAVPPRLVHPNCVQAGEPYSSEGDEQGEWKRADIESDVWRLMIDGSQISNVCYDTDGTVLEVKEYEFDLDDAGNLVVTEYGKPRYIYTIDENGQLVSEKNGTGTTTFYEKVSDTANVPDAPEEKLEPAIGMTESEVYASTWGTPKKINRTETAYGVREQWVYDEGYIYLKDGRVTSIQD